MIALTLLAAASPPSADVAYARAVWSTNFSLNDRVILTTRGVGEDNGADKIRAICMAKGGDDAIMEPVTFADIHSSLVRISSRAACAFAGTDGFFGKASWSASGRRTEEAGSGEASGSCGIPPPTCCAVKDGSPPNRADGLPICTNPTPMARTDSWYGEYDADIYSQFTFALGNVNGQEVSEIAAGGVSASWTIEAAKGIGASVVEPPGFASGDAGNPYGLVYNAEFASNGAAPWAMYDGGIMITAAIGSDLTYRLFMFKNDELLTAAKQVPENAGLPYAHPFPGANGCNAEVVYEFKPKANGGLEVAPVINQLLMSVVKTAKWYATELEVVILVSRAELKKAARYPVPTADGCDDNVDEEIVRFSRSFICKATGERVTATVNGPSGLLGTATEPTKYEDAYASKMSATESDADFGQPSIDFSLSLSEGQAPTSCEAMYWDPYLQTPLGDVPQSVSPAGGAAASSSPSGGLDLAAIIGIAVGGGVFVLLLIVGVVCYCRYRSKVAARKRAPQKV